MAPTLADTVGIFLFRLVVLYVLVRRNQKPATSQAQPTLQGDEPAQETAEQVEYESVASISSVANTSGSVLQPLYQALSSKTHIRLVTLEGGKSSILYASLKEVDLAEEPVYEAISYVWGSPRFVDKHIVLNGRKVVIRDNLWEALQRIRHASGSRVLWVDALSICQTDHEEKAHQVILIGNIFKQASQVLVWMGEHERHSEALFRPWHITRTDDDKSKVGTHTSVKDIKQLSPDHEGGKKKKRNWWLKRVGKERPGKVGADHPYGLVGSTSTSTSNEELYRTKKEIWTSFINREYWTRRWITQEILLAQAITVHCGDSKMGWEELIETKHIHRRLSEDVLLDDIVFSGLEVKLLFFRLLALRKQKVRTIPLLEMMTMFRDSQCSDDRDQMYAFLALDPVHGSITPSYDIDSTEVFCRLLESQLDQVLPARPRPSQYDNEQIEKVKKVCRAFNQTADQKAQTLTKFSASSSNISSHQISQADRLREARYWQIASWYAEVTEQEFLLWDPELFHM